MKFWRLRLRKTPLFWFIKNIAKLKKKLRFLKLASFVFLNIFVLALKKNLLFLKEKKKERKNFKGKIKNELF